MLFFWRQPKYQSEIHQFMNELAKDYALQKEKGLKERQLVHPLKDSIEIQDRALSHRANPYF